MVTGTEPHSGFGRSFLHLAGLWGFAVAQPLFDLLGRHAIFLVAHRVSRLEVVLLVLLTILLVPALLTGVEWLVGVASARARAALHLVLVGLLAAVALLPVLNRLIALPRPALPLFVVVAAALLAGAYARFRRFREFLTILSPAAVLFAAFFLFATPVSRLVLPTASAAEAATPVAASRTPVVVVVFDELPIASLMRPDGSMDADRFPNFGRLADTATWYRNATAVHPTTRFSVPSILTGSYATSSIPISSEYPRNLFSALDASHRLDVWELVTQLCPPDRCESTSASGEGDPRPRLMVVLDDLRIMYLHTILPASWRSELPPIDQQWTHFGNQQADAPEATPSEPTEVEIDPKQEQAAVKQRFREAIGEDHSERFARFVNGIQARLEPSLHYAHVMLPHRPFQYMPSGRRYAGSFTPAEDPDRGGYWTPNEYLLDQWRQRHLLQVGHVDGLIGELIDRLQSENIFDNALIVVTADHGISFVPGQPIRKLVRDNAAGVVSVPLLIKYPGQRQGIVDERNVELIDIFPTILHTLEAEPPADLDGESLLQEGPVRGDEKFVDYTGDEFSLPGSMLDELLEIAGRTHAALGPFAGDFDLFAIGPDAALVGRSLNDLDVGTASEARAALIGAEAVFDLDPASDVWPSRFIGRLRFAEPPSDPVRVLITVNGVVAGVGQTYRHTGEGADDMSILTADHLFRAGNNDVRLFEIDDGPSVTLHEIEIIDWSSE